MSENLITWLWDTNNNDMCTSLGYLYLQTYEITNGRERIPNEPHDDHQTNTFGVDDSDVDGHGEDSECLQESSGIEITLSSVENGGVVDGSSTSLEDVVDCRTSLETPIDIDQRIDSITTTTSKRSNRTASTTSDSSSISNDEEDNKKLSLPQRYALSVATNPKKHLTITLFITLFLTLLTSAITFFTGAFEVDVRLGPWLTRNTLISKRALQSYVHLGRYANLFGIAARIPNTNSTWDDLSSPDDPKPADLDYKTVPYQKESSIDYHDTPSYQLICDGEWYESGYLFHPNQMNLMGVFKTVDANEEGGSSSNDEDEGGGGGGTRSALEAGALYDMCVQEARVLQQLEDNDLCYKCNLDTGEEEKCIQPYSLVAAARLYLSE